MQTALSCIWLIYMACRAAVKMIYSRYILPICEAKVPPFSQQEKTMRWAMLLS